MQGAWPIVDTLARILLKMVPARASVTIPKFSLEGSIAKRSVKLWPKNPSNALKSKMMVY